MRKFPKPNEPCAIIGKEKAWQLDLFIYANTYARIFNSTSWEMGTNPSFQIPDFEDFETTNEWLNAIIRINAEKDRRLRDHPRLAAENAAIRQAQRGIHLSWTRIKNLVWERDGGICQVCERAIDRDEYDCGHIIDRVAGGSDRPSNLVVMCDACNQAKPVHRTFEEFLEWVESGHWRLSVLSYMLHLPPIGPTY